MIDSLARSEGDIVSADHLAADDPSGFLSATGIVDAADFNAACIDLKPVGTVRRQQQAYGIALFSQGLGGGVGGLPCLPVGRANDQ